MGQQAGRQKKWPWSGGRECGMGGQREKKDTQPGSNAHGAFQKRMQPGHGAETLSLTQRERERDRAWCSHTGRSAQRLGLLLRFENYCRFSHKFRIVLKPFPIKEITANCKLLFFLYLFQSKIVVVHTVHYRTCTRKSWGQAPAQP